MGEGGGGGGGGFKKGPIKKNTVHKTLNSFLNL